jgi:hypothetical protein
MYELIKEAGKDKDASLLRDGIIMAVKIFMIQALGEEARLFVRDNSSQLCYICI